jgi:DNA polymerase epsilon subunit 2
LEISAKTDKRLIQLESQDDSAMLVFLSDVWLDKPEVTTRLQRLFLGYSAMPPAAFIFMGNFMASSTESGPQKIKSYKDLLKNFADVLSEHQELANTSKFIFVPGPNDPGHASIYPRPPIPEFISQELVAKIPNCKYFLQRSIKAIFILGKSTNF